MFRITKICSARWRVHALTYDCLRGTLDINFLEFSLICVLRCVKIKDLHIFASLPCRTLSIVLGVVTRAYTGVRVCLCVCGVCLLQLILVNLKRFKTKGNK